jgi:hypothetical protein
MGKREADTTVKLIAIRTEDFIFTFTPNLSD